MYDNNKNSLIPLKENNIIKKIIGFFKRLFFKQKDSNNANVIKENNEDIIKETEEKVSKNSFLNDIKIEEKTKDKTDMQLLEKFRNGDIDEEEMTDEQFECLCNSYKEKISQLKESNQKRKQVLLAYRKQLKTSN